MDAAQIKYYLDKLRAEASKGSVPGGTVFVLTDPIMNAIGRGEIGKSQRSVSEARKAAWETRRKRYGEKGHGGKFQNPTDQ